MMSPLGEQEGLSAVKMEDVAFKAGEQVKTRMLKSSQNHPKDGQRGGNHVSSKLRFRSTEPRAPTPTIVCGSPAASS